MTEIDKWTAVHREYTKGYKWNCEDCPLNKVQCLGIFLFDDEPSAEEKELITAVYDKLLVLPAVTEDDLLSVLAE